jgi:hypothetical protein
MQLRNQYQVNHSSTVLYVFEGEGGEGGEGGQGGETLEAKIAAAVAEATKGLKSKNDELLGIQRQLKDKLKPFEGMDPVKLSELQSRLDQDEDAKLFAEGKKESVIQKYTERMREAHQNELKTFEQKIAAAEERAKRYQQAVLDNHIRAACKDLHPGAVDDALLHARQIFTLDDQGNAVQLDAEGNPELGKNGKTPFSPAEWIEQQKEKKPHWFPSNTSGSGSSNARQSGSNASGKTIKRSDYEALPMLKQAEVARSGIRIVD